MTSSRPGVRQAIVRESTPPQPWAPPTWALGPEGLTLYRNGTLVAMFLDRDSAEEAREALATSGEANRKVHADCDQRVEDVVRECERQRVAVERTAARAEARLREHLDAARGDR